MGNLTADGRSGSGPRQIKGRGEERSLTFMYWVVDECSEGVANCEIPSVGPEVSQGRAQERTVKMRADRQLCQLDHDDRAHRSERPLHECRVPSLA